MPDSVHHTTSARLPYLWLALSVAVLALVSNFFGEPILHRLSDLEDAPAAPVLAALALFALCSFVSFYATRGTPFPSFVAAIALGIAGHTLLAPIVSNPATLASLVTAAAAIILFSGGIEMPLRDFLRLFDKIALLAFPGLLITGIAVSWAVASLAGALGFVVAPAVVILLGAILASTDPAAIIPVLHNVRFKRQAPKEIVVAESALNDVTGALLTSAFLKLSLVALPLAAAYGALNSAASFRFLAQQIGGGALFGLAGCALLWFLVQFKRRHLVRYGADQVFFLGVPLIAFAGAAAFGGSGFLAAFVAGLVFKGEGHMAEIERFFNQVIDGVAKPVIFLLVGALVDVHALLAYAPLGIAVALVLMFVIRPAMVFLALGGYALFAGSARALSVKELLFISFVRETGAIQAVLLVTAVARMTTPVHGLVEIGMWVILLTLVIAPPLTPWVARKLGVAD